MTITLFGLALSAYAAFAPRSKSWGGVAVRAVAAFSGLYIAVWL